MMRILVCGGRDYRDAWRVWHELQLLILEGNDRDEVTIVHGDARGADSLADCCAQLSKYHVERHPADWTRYKRAAGGIRNKEMLDSGVDFVIAFPGGSGTANMVKQARFAGVEVREIT